LGQFGRGAKGSEVLDEILHILEVLTPLFTALIAAVSTHLLHQRHAREVKKFDIKKHAIFDHFAFYDNMGIRIMTAGKGESRDFYMKKYASTVLGIFRTRLMKLVEEMDTGTELHLPNVLVEMMSSIKTEVQTANIPLIFYTKIFAKESAQWKLVFDEVSTLQKSDAIDYYSKMLLFFNSVSLLYGNMMLGLELLCNSLNGELDKEIERIEKDNRTFKGSHSQGGMI